MTSDRFYTPEIVSPYPKTFELIENFEYSSHLRIGRKNKKIVRYRESEVSYVVLRDYSVTFTVDGRRQRLTVPAGMMTDLASVPAFARPAIGRVGPHLEASIVHDFLFVAWQLLPTGVARPSDWRFANEVMYAALRQTAMAAWKQWAVRRALNGFSWRVFREAEPDRERLFLDPERDCLFRQINRTVADDDATGPPRSLLTAGLVPRPALSSAVS
ncbi:DUF1353 domain-containing protein [Algihabitans albus]|uniref:DUF1353 domain-containing protein n=1 Tax=Algihabitans albus TaxID=2164067 RepID=UPI000E5D9844|nr:DUF1353 domain-containing protein [Algihabitans albus]